MTDLTAIRERLEKSSKGKWSWWTSNSHVRLSLDDCDGRIAWADVNHRDGVGSIVIKDTDAALIENAPSDIALLLDEVERLNNKCDLMLEALNACRDYTDGKTTDPIQAVVSVRRALKAIEAQEQGKAQ